MPTNIFIASDKNYYKQITRADAHQLDAEGLIGHPLGSVIHYVKHT